MTGLTSSEVRIAGTGAIWRAPLGSTLPTNSTTALDAAFKNLGYASDGFGLKQDKKTTSIPAWQTLRPVRVITTDLDRVFSFELLQTNVDTLALAWGGATITPTSGGVYSMTIDSADNPADAIYVIDWSDGAVNQRILIKKGALTSLPEIKGMRTDATRYAFEVTPVAPTDGSSAVVIFGVDTAVGGA